MPVYTLSLEPEQLADALKLHHAVRADFQEREKMGAFASFWWLAERDLIKEHPDIGDMTQDLFADFLRDVYGPCKCDPPYSGKQYCTGDCRWNERGEVVG